MSRYGDASPGGQYTSPMLYYVPMTKAPASTLERIGVLVVNLGTPDSPSYFAVQRYLREFLSDRRVIDTSRLIWLPLLYGVVLPFRPVRTVRNYRKVWMHGGSPLAVYSKRLTTKLGVLMQARFGDRIPGQVPGNGRRAIDSGSGLERR